eukprot:Em0019g1076a
MSEDSSVSVDSAYTKVVRYGASRPRNSPRRETGSSGLCVSTHTLSADEAKIGKGDRGKELSLLDDEPFRYGKTGMGLEWQMKLQCHVQRPGESLLGFAGELRRIASKAFSDWSNGQLEELMQLMKGMPRSINDAVPVELARKLELLSRHRGAYAKKDGTTFQPQLSCPSEWGSAVTIIRADIWEKVSKCTVSTLAPATQAVVAANGKGLQLDEIVLEPQPNFMERHGLAVAHSVAINRDGAIPVQMLNPVEASQGRISACEKDREVGPEIIESLIMGAEDLSDIELEQLRMLLCRTRLVQHIPRVPTLLSSDREGYRSIVGGILHNAFWVMQCTQYLPKLDGTGPGCRTVQEHFQNLMGVFQRLKQAGLKLKPMKCHLFRNKITAPLNRLLEKGKQWQWTEQCLQAFTLMKTKLTSAPLLVYPNFEEAFMWIVLQAMMVLALSCPRIIKSCMMPQQGDISVWRKVLEKAQQRFYWVDQRQDVEEWCRTCTICGAQKSPAKQMHPYGNGMIERFNRTLLSMLKRATIDAERDWDLKLPCLMMAYRTSTKATPFSFMALEQRLVAAYEHIREHLGIEQRRHKQFYDHKPYLTRHLDDEPMPDESGREEHSLDETTEDEVLIQDGSRDEITSENQYEEVLVEREDDTLVRPTEPDMLQGVEHGTESQLVETGDATEEDPKN